MHVPEKVAALQDLEMTPKASKVVSRTTSADTFLKSDFHRRSSLINASRFSVRGERNPLLSRKKLRNESAGSSKPPPVAPERRSSKSKRFLQLGLTSRDHHVDQIQSTATKKKLIRCVSRNRNLISSSSEESLKSRLSNNFYVERSSNYKDIFEVQRSSFENSLDTPLLSSMCSEDNIQHLDALVLCPEIKIIPEVTSVDIGDFCFWVAIEIKGVLRRPDRDFDKCEQKEDLVTSDARYSNLSDIKKFGSLDSMHMNIEADKHCHISKIIGDYHGPLTIKANQTHLILVKVQFDSIMPSRDHRELSSEELISELQNDLGDNLTPYLTIRLHYRHSGFYAADLSSINTCGINSNSTLLQTEATAAITRYNPRSVWSPCHLKISRDISPILHLIEINFYPREAEDAIKQVSEGRAMILSSGLLWQANRLSESIDESVTYSSPISYDSNLATIRKSSSKIPSSVAHLPQAYLPRELTDEVDPARKIWVEMRRTSLGNSLRKNRSSRCRKCGGKESCLNPVHASERKIPTKEQNSKVEHERGEIMGVALKNKRSLGEETLRSIAPSIVNNYELKERYESEARFSPGMSVGTGVAKNWLMGLFPRS
ncbi:hypothetical protein K3495_g9723 [Podosphaera aphanis]|nr:hypothetical protein K3495_g9723 [Podosphaera aphanis]